MLEPVLMSDVRVASLPALDSSEPLVDLEAAGIMRFSDRKRATNPASTLPTGLALFGIEAYRPPSLQQLYYRTYLSRLAAEHPELGAPELRALTSRFVSPPEVAPHPTGAAIDLTLRSDDGLEVDMGCPVDATPEDSHGT